MTRVRFFPIIVSVLMVASSASARSFRPAQIPNGSVNSCANCHVNPAGGGTRNDFGKLVEKMFLDVPGATGNVEWNPYLAALDADLDGVSNGEELQDRFGVWVNSDPAPGGAAFVTLPGSFSSSPWRSLTLTVTDEGPHAGQVLWVKLIDKATGRTTTRTSMSIPASVPFNVNLTGLRGHSYWMEIFADGNGNDAYDGPAIDHSWLREINNVGNDTTVFFAHVAIFETLDWTYSMNFVVSGLSDYTGHWMEARLIDVNDNSEVDRIMVPAINADLLSFNFRGIKGEGNYRIDTFIDVNDNNEYDGLSSDVSWSVPFTASGTDMSQIFSTSQATTSIDWKYRTIVNLVDMGDELGEAFGLRVIDLSTGLQEGYVELDAIEVPDFTINMPVSTPGINYQVDFYADANGNGSYDAPPTDHAWRLFVTNGYGNGAGNFVHTTNYTDINWSTNSLRNLPGEGIPVTYSLAQNYPNPFNPSTMIGFSVARQGQVTLAVFDLLGREVRRLVDKPLAPGVYNVPFNATGLPSGHYFYRMQTSGFTQTKRLTLVR